MRLKASYTIEHAYIVPYVIINIMVILTLSFMMHDMLILKSTAVITSQKLEKDSKKIQVDKIINDSLLYLRKNVLLLKNIKLDVREKDNSIKVVINGNFLLTYKELEQFTQLQQSGNISISNPIAFIRKIKAFEESIQQR